MLDILYKVFFSRSTCYGKKINKYINTNIINNQREKIFKNGSNKNQSKKSLISLEFGFFFFFFFEKSQSSDEKLARHAGCRALHRCTYRQTGITILNASHPRSARDVFNKLGRHNNGRVQSFRFIKIKLFSLPGVLTLLSCRRGERRR